VAREAVEDLGLAHVRDLRRAHVHFAQHGGIDEIGRLLDGGAGRAGLGDEGSAPHLRVERTVVHEVLVSPRNGTGRDAQPPGDLAHRRQAVAGRQRAVRDGGTDRLLDRLVLGSGGAVDGREPSCIHDNVSVDRYKRILYQSG
jgi:hypothetical protein